MSAFQNILTIMILFLLFVVVYCRMTNKSLTDFVREIVEIFRESDNKK
jgi:hypothetical protein